jgi:hypothetical protein
MGKWTGVITNSGAELFSGWTAGETLTLTRAAAGSGTVAEAALMAQTALVKERQRADILSATASEKGRKVKLQVTAAESAYTMRQIGLFGKLGGEEKLLAIFQANADTPIPSKEDMPDFVYTFAANLAVDNQTGKLEITVDPTALVTRESLEEAKEAQSKALEAHNEDPEAHNGLIVETVGDELERMAKAGELVTPEKLEQAVIDELNANPSGGYYGTYNVTIPESGWVETTDKNEDYAYICDVAAEDVDEELVPSGVVEPGYSRIAMQADMVNACSTMDGKFRFYSKRVPNGDIHAVITLFSKSGRVVTSSGTVSGAAAKVEIGNGLEYDVAGKIAVKVGDGVSFDKYGAITVDKAQVVTDEDLLDEDETEESLKEILLGKENGSDN